LAFFLTNSTMSSPWTLFTRRSIVSEALAWGGWVGAAAGSGTIVYDWKIVDKSGPPMSPLARALRPRGR
jgi:hypothetical protein